MLWILKVSLKLLPWCHLMTFAVTSHALIQKNYSFVISGQKGKACAVTLSIIVPSLS